MFFSSRKTGWWQFLNPAIYLISILPALLVLILANQPLSDYAPLVVSMIAVVLLQHAINLFNDVSDWHRGADTHKANSWVRYYEGNSRPVYVQAILNFVAGASIGLLVLIIYEELWIIWFATPLIFLGYLYNAGKSPLSYTMMGEWVTGICYAGVFAGYWAVAGLTLNGFLFLGTLSSGLLAISLLLSHQSPQLETDRSVGKHSFCVRYGIEKTQRYSVVLYLCSMLLIQLGVLLKTEGTLQEVMLFIFIVVSTGVLRKIGPSPKRILISSSVYILMMTLFTV